MKAHKHRCSRCSGRVKCHNRRCNGINRDYYCDPCRGVLASVYPGFNNGHRRTGADLARDVGRER